MSPLLGLDLGTSSAKAVVTNLDGHLLARGTQTYPIESSQPGWAEQNPERWWQAVVQAARQAVSAAGAVEIQAIGLSGQMHGTVLLDRHRRPLGNAITWLDRRSAAEAAEIVARLGRRRLARLTGTAPAAGFMGPTLLWLARHEPQRLESAIICLLPKDYIRLRLTGTVGTEPTDASGTGLFDIRRRSWATELLGQLALPKDKLPEVRPSAQVAGRISNQVADELTVPSGTPVAFGCADQVAQAIGNGVFDPGQASLTVGTGGQLFVATDRPQPDPELRWHAFCHAPNQRWYQLGAMLSAGLSLRWLGEMLGLDPETHGYERLALLVRETPPAAAGLLFLPYLAGERTPHMDPRARGAFVGLTLEHGPGHLARSVMEGVAYALRQILELLTLSAGQPQRLVAAGNGLASATWRQIMADVLGHPLHYVNEP
ncbi:MAG: xylulokinase, partial [Candidatus Promineifilaceae bacterium]|nr:xylulokinase [Candidatus Promineifilaceae bacterium]